MPSFIAKGALTIAHALAYALPTLAFAFSFALGDLAERPVPIQLLLQLGIV